MEFTIKITNEELLKLILLQKKDNETNDVLEEPVKKRRGRPRIHEPKNPDAPLIFRTRHAIARQSERILASCLYR